MCFEITAHRCQCKDGKWLNCKDKYDDHYKGYCSWKGETCALQN